MIVFGLFYYKGADDRALELKEDYEKVCETFGGKRLPWEVAVYNKCIEDNLDPTNPKHRELAEKDHLEDRDNVLFWIMEGGTPYDAALGTCRLEDGACFLCYDASVLESEHCIEFDEMKARQAAFDTSAVETLHRKYAADWLGQPRWMCLTRVDLYSHHD